MYPQPIPANTPCYRVMICPRTGELCFNLVVAWMPSASGTGAHSMAVTPVTVFPVHREAPVFLTYPNGKGSSGTLKCYDAKGRLVELEQAWKELERWNKHVGECQAKRATAEAAR